MEQVFEITNAEGKKIAAFKLKEISYKKIVSKTDAMRFERDPETKIHYDYNASVLIKDQFLCICGYTETPCFNKEKGIMEYLKKSFHEEFNIGDVAIVSVGNTIQTDIIKKINPSSVVFGSETVSLFSFIKHNHDLDLSKVAEENYEYTHSFPQRKMW